MKKLVLAVAGIITLALLFLPACSRSTSPDTTAATSISPELKACQQVITGYWNAFNSYDLEKCLSYLTPAYAESRKAGLKSELERFEMGRGLGVKMVAAAFLEQGALPDGRLDIRVTMNVTPKGIYNDQFLMYYMINQDGVWKIDKQTSDPERMPPGRGPQNLRANIVSANQVDLTWEDRSSIETGYRLERALDTAFKAGLVTFTLPADTQAYTDTTTQATTTYYYRVLAFNKVGDSPAAPTIPVRIP